MIHTPVRLSVVAAVASAEAVDFAYLRDTLEVTDSLLSKHLSVLEPAGYVQVSKGYEGRPLRTWLSLTAQGQAAYDDYRTVLTQIIDGQ